MTCASGCEATPHLGDEANDIPPYVTCSCGLSTLATAGIAIGVIAVVGIAGGLAAYFICKAKKAARAATNVV